MKKFCEVMVIVYIILFIPVSIASGMFESVMPVGAENVSKFIVSTVGFAMKILPLAVFGAAGFGYAMNKNEKYNISFYILMLPIVVLMYIWIGIMFA